MMSRGTGFLLWCIEIAQRTYSNAKIGESLIEVRDESSNEVIERALVGRHEDRLLLAIRGTQVTTNWLRNVDTTLLCVGENGEAVHRGFKLANDDLIAHGLNEAIRAETQGVDMDVLLIAHSKGGAQATLFAYEFLKKGQSVELVTFGSPRLGNKAFADAMAKYQAAGKLRHTRCIHSMDPVVAVPMQAEFTHCTPAYQVDKAPAAAAADILAAAVRATEDHRDKAHERLAHCHTLDVYAHNIRLSASGQDRGQEAVKHIGTLAGLFVQKFLPNDTTVQVQTTQPATPPAEQRKKP